MSTKRARYDEEEDENDFIGFDGTLRVSPALIGPTIYQHRSDDDVVMIPTPKLFKELFGYRLERVSRTAVVVGYTLLFEQIVAIADPDYPWIGPRWTREAYRARTEAGTRLKRDLSNLEREGEIVEYGKDELVAAYERKIRVGLDVLSQINDEI